MSDDSPANAKTQRGEILALLIKARGDWVPLPEIMACAAQYNARVFELRRLGFSVENRTDTIDGVRHSWFRLAASKPETETAKLAGSGDWYGSSRPKVEPSQPGAALPLFAEVSR